MLIPLPFNDSVVIRLFEPTEMTHSCARGMDILGVSYDEDKYRDAVGVTVSSTFLHEEVGTAQEIKETVDASIANAATPVSDPPVEIDDTSFSPEYQTAIDEPVDTTLPAVDVLGLM